MENTNEMNTTTTKKPVDTFKKPIFIGKIGRLPRKLTKITKPETDSHVELSTNERSSDELEQVKTTENIPETVPEKLEQIKTTETTQEKLEQAPQNTAFPYTEPKWSGLPPQTSKNYSFEVLKNGAIIENIDLMSKPFYTFGRLKNCDICMQHPTVSRYHAVLQYRSESSETDSPGFYLYDLNSTHGTFLNKNKLKPKVYVRIQVGHLLKLGCSTRSYILNGPNNDTEEESALSVTELKQKRLDDIRKREEAENEAILERERKEEELRKRIEERGIDWGLGEDAEEEDETDLTENPYAQTTNEDLYLDNPKKALRGFFEREGLDLEYDCNEQGMGQFLCKIELPLDDEKGRPIFAEVLHKGKKKEAVLQCALEACRILDRFGLLRQATHESRKRKPKNWEENDYYDSDDDTYLDRTGTVEKKREMRMNAKLPQKAATYESLIENEKKLTKQIKQLQNQISDALNKLNLQRNTNQEEDSLDSFMKELKQPKMDKQTVNKLKTELTKLKNEHLNVIKLINVAKPTDLPAIIPNYDSVIQDKNNTTNKSNNQKLPIFGKRMKIKVQLPEKSNTDQNVEEIDDEDVEREEVVEDVHKMETSEPVSINNSDSKSQITKEDTSNIITDSIASASTNLVSNSLKKKKNNQRRIQQRQHNAEVEKRKGYDEDKYKEDYNMWVPPSGQTGDGKTKLNEKYGY